jgi:CrcB protein
MNILYVILGGSLGAGARYLISTFAQQTAKTSFPIGTFTVNMIGAFVAGFLFHLAELHQISHTTRLFLFAGILGGFTTFSAYALESLMLFKDGESSLMLLNVLLSNILGLLAVYIGYVISKSVF